MLNSVRQMSWQKTQPWGLYKTQDGSGTSHQQSSKKPSMLNSVRQKPWQKTQPWGLYKTQDGSSQGALKGQEFRDREIARLPWAEAGISRNPLNYQHLIWLNGNNRHPQTLHGAVLSAEFQETTDDDDRQGLTQPKLDSEQLGNLRRLDYFQSTRLAVFVCTVTRNPYPFFLSS